MWDHVRKLFAATQEAKVRGYLPGRFSFNVAGGRCEACAGDGTIKIEMHFLPDVYVPCEVCKGKRYNRDTLDITFKDKNVSDVLDLSCEEALEFFGNQPAISRHMQTLVDVGLGYVRLGQPATTLSGGEAQRVKLASELAKRSTGHTIYILDEPTTGLHFEDIRKLLTVLSRLVDQGNTVLVIEHNLDVIKTADWIIDLGPEGGNGGGTRRLRGHARGGGRGLQQLDRPVPAAPARSGVLESHVRHRRCLSGCDGGPTDEARRPAPAVRWASSSSCSGSRRSTPRSSATTTFTGTSRFGWTVAYAGILCVFAYGFGLPDVPRSRQAALGPAVGAAFLGAAGDLGRPAVRRRRAAAPLRGVRHRAAAARLVPDLRVDLASAVARRAEARDRVVVVAARRRGRRASSSSSHASPERPASIVAQLHARRGRRRRRAPTGPIEALLDGALPTVLVLDRDAQDAAERSWRRRLGCTSAGVRVRSLTVLLRGVARQAADVRARAGVDALRHRRGAPHRLRPGQAAASTSRSPLAGLRRPRSSSSRSSWLGNLVGQPRPAASTARTGSARAAQVVHDPQVPHHGAAAVRRARQRVDHRGRPADHPLRPAPPADPPRRAARRW